MKGTQIPSRYLARASHEAPIVGVCDGCGRSFLSKYQRKTHVCRASAAAETGGDSLTKR
jgi:hypothetical protein